MAAPFKAAVLGDRFRLERLAGVGGMGEVYYGRDLRTEEPVAVKLLKAGGSRLLHRFSREAAVLSELTHPAIVRYIAHGLGSADRPYIAMEWLEGETLARRLGDGPLSVEEALQLARRVSDGLSVAHARGIIHRDLKPDNLFLVGGETHAVKILDFGVAKRLVEAAGVLTRSGDCIGTPSYMSPEQIRGQPLDVRTDLFSLGAVLYECLVGDPPFVADALGIAEKICLHMPPWPHSLRSGIPEPLESLVMRMLSKEPALRPADARELARELSAVEERCASEVRAAEPLRSLATREQRVLTVVMVDNVGTSDETLDEDEDRDGGCTDESGIRRVAAPFDGTVERFSNGRLVVRFVKAGSARHQVVQAASFALDLARAFPQVRIAVSHGRGVLHGRLATGAVVERAELLLSHAAPAIALDGAAAELLESQFQLAGRPWGASLLGEGSDETRPHPSPALAPFVGRRHELQMLLGTCAECFEEPAARGALVLAPAGMGKTRLSLELVNQLCQLRSNTSLLAGQGDPIRSNAPFSLLSSLLRRAATISTGATLALRSERLRAHLHQVFGDVPQESLLAFLGELAGIPFSDARLPALKTARNDPRIMADQIREAFLAYLRGCLARGPVFVLLEDLHWADLPSVQLMDAALRVHSAEPLYVLALARPELAERFPKLWDGTCIDRMTLSPFTPRVAERFVRGLLGNDAEASQLARLVERAQGNPFFLHELVRAWTSGREVLTDGVLSAIQARLDALGADANRVLRAASVFGEEFSLAGVQALTGEGQERLERYWEMFEAHELTVRSGPAGLEFRHDLVRETCYAALTPEDRALGHRLAGEFLARSSDTDPAVLALHFDRGSLPERAIPCYARAAFHALQGEDFDGARALCERGVALGARGELLADLRSAELQVHLQRADFAEAEKAGLEALRHTQEGSVRWYGAVRDLAEPLGEQLKTDQLVRIGALVECVASAQASADREEGEPELVSARIASLAWLAGATTGHGHPGLGKRLLALCEQFLARSGGATAAWALARFHLARGNVRSWTGQPAESLADSEAALAAALEARDARLVFFARGNIGIGLLDLGAPERSAAVLSAALREGGKFVESPLGGPVKLSLALARFWCGECEAGRAELLELIGRGEWKRLESISRSRFVRIELALSNLASAEQEARRLLDELSSGQPLVVTTVQALLANVLLASNRPAEALEHALIAFQELKRTGSVQDFEGLVPLMAAEAFWANGRELEAKEALREAYERLMTRADAISDPELRHSFLHRIEEHARTLQLCERWGVST